MLNFPGVSLCPSQHHQSALPAIRHPALLIISLLPRASNHRCPEPRNLYTPSLPLTRSRNNTTEILRNNLKTSQRVPWFYNGCLNLVLQKKIFKFPPPQPHCQASRWYCTLVKTSTSMQLHYALIYISPVLQNLWRIDQKAFLQLQCNDLTLPAGSLQRISRRTLAEMIRRKHNFFLAVAIAPPSLLVIHRFRKLGRSEAGAIQQPRSLEQQPSVGVTRRLHNSTLCLIGFLSTAPVTERRIHLSCRLQAAGCNLRTPTIQEVWNRDAGSFTVGTILVSELLS